MPATHKEKISDTSQLIPSTIPIPLVNHISMAADTLVTLLQRYSTSPPPRIKIGDPVIQGVMQIANILKTMYPLTTPIASIPKLTTSPIITQHILPTQAPEELTNLSNISMLASIPRLEIPPVPPTPSVVLLLRVKKKNTSAPHITKQNIVSIND